MVLLSCAEQQNKTQPNVNGNHDLISQQWSAEMRMNYDLIVTQNIPSSLEITGYFLMGFFAATEDHFHAQPSSSHHQCDVDTVLKADLRFREC